MLFLRIICCRSCLPACGGKRWERKGVLSLEFALSAVGAVVFLAAFFGVRQLKIPNPLAQIDLVSQKDIRLLVSFLPALRKLRFLPDLCRLLCLCKTNADDGARCGFCSTSGGAGERICFYARWSFYDQIWNGSLHVRRPWFACARVCYVRCVRRVCFHDCCGDCPCNTHGCSLAFLVMPTTAYSMTGLDEVDVKHATGMS